jgi:hypothetical protein
MNSNQEHALTHPRKAGVRNRIGAALAVAAVCGGIVGVGLVGVAGEASAKPSRETTNKGTCTEINQEIRSETRFLTTLRKEQVNAMNDPGGFNTQQWHDAQDFIDQVEKNLKGLQSRARAIGC